MFQITFDQIDNSLLTEDKQIFKKMKIGVEFAIENNQFRCGREEIDLTLIFFANNP